MGGAYRYFAPAILGNRSRLPPATPNTNNTNSANNPTSASRTFASYLGWPSTIAALQKYKWEKHSGTTLLQEVAWTVEVFSVVVIRGEGGAP